VKAYKEKLKMFSSKDSNMKKLSEITEKKSKELEKLNNDVTILKIKLAERERQVEALKDENL
jgi:predicted RNase H-like nuclease (RuvC/YqgF family)